MIEDILWVIEKEILEDSATLKKYLKNNNIPITIKSIIFFRYFNNSIESLNYLETRGRDSARLQVAPERGGGRDGDV